MIFGLHISTCQYIWADFVRLKADDIMARRNHIRFPIHLDGLKQSTFVVCSWKNRHSQRYDSHLWPLDPEARVLQLDQCSPKINTKHDSLGIIYESAFMHITGVPGRLLLSFSVYSNAPKILNTNQPKGTLTSVNGIRFLSMTWVILGHTFGFGATGVGMYKLYTVGNYNFSEEVMN